MNPLKAVKHSDRHDTRVSPWVEIQRD